MARPKDLEGLIGKLAVYVDTGGTRHTVALAPAPEEEFEVIGPDLQDVFSAEAVEIEWRGPFPPVLRRRPVEDVCGLDYTGNPRDYLHSSWRVEPIFTWKQKANLRRHYLAVRKDAGTHR